MFEAWLNRWWRWLVLAGVALHVTQLFGTLLEPDAALYANVAKNVATSGDFLNLYAYHQDWLDKPHMPFWLAGASMKLFGITEFAYRLPALLVFLLGVFYVWKLGSTLFDDTVAKLAVLMTLTSQHLVMSSADVRAEPYLIGFITAAVFHSLRAHESWKHLVFGAFFTACALMTKGPFVVLPIVAAVFAADWRRALTWKLVPFALASLLFITPEMYALWTQFDLHPEKSVLGMTGVSGLRFFFWDSQFGRFTNTGTFHGRGDPSFFFHTILWAFLPWSLWLYAAFVDRIRGTWKPGANIRPLLGASLSVFILFSASRFQLPHYMNIAYPFFSLFVAAWVAQTQRTKWVVIPGQILAVGIVLFGALLLGLNQSFIAVAILVALAVTAFVLFKTIDAPNTVGRMALAAIALNLTLGFGWWQDLLRHQVGNDAARVVNAMPPGKTALIGVESLTFDFRLNAPLVRFTVDDMRIVERGSVQRALMHADSMNVLREMGYRVDEVARFEHFQTSKLSGKFIVAGTRAQATEPWVVVELDRK